MDITSTPAEMIYAEAAAAEAADQVVFYNPATTTPHSLMQELPPRPPSPYKSMQSNVQRSTQAKTTVTAAFLRGRRNVYGAPAAPVGIAANRASDGDADAGGHGEFSGSLRRSLTYHSTQSGDSAVVHADTETHDSAMQHFLRYGVPRQRLVDREESKRNALLATEEVVYTGLLIQSLHERAELLAGQEAEGLVVAAALERAEARREMLKIIEVEVAARLRDQRIAELLEVQFQALLPAHAAGYQRIQAQEKEGLRQVFLWHKEHRPLGPGCYIKGPEEDYRLRNVSRGTSAAASSTNGRTPLAISAPRSGATSAHSSREYAEQLRQKNSRSATPNAALGELALIASEDDGAHASSTQDGTYGPGEEAVFAEEGRLRLQTQKARRTAELREIRRYTDLAEAQADARQYVLAEEALRWMQVLQGTVDGHYAAAEATRQRLLSEARENTARAERDAERAALKEQMLRARGLPEQPAERAAKEATASPPKISKVAELMLLCGRRSSGSGAGERYTSDVHRKSNSTVAESAAATDASLDPLPEMDEVSVAELGSGVGGGEGHGGDAAPLAHLRLIAEETDSTMVCRKLTTLTSGGEEGAAEDLDEL